MKINIINIGILLKNYLVLTIFLVAILLPSCGKKDDTVSPNTISNETKIKYSTEKEFVGTWIEKYPLQYDRISDTIVFTPDSTVSKYIHFNNWGYRVKNDTIQFINPTQGRNYSFHFTPISDSEIVFNNFIDRLVSQQVKNITYVKK
ncbi:MAG: hypothetical protein QM541_01680 [Flavobacterium sp.]|nr:hypothetical protein [Flavobacterium sp.]